MTTFLLLILALLFGGYLPSSIESSNLVAFGILPMAAQAFFHWSLDAKRILTNLTNLVLLTVLLSGLVETSAWYTVLGIGWVFAAHSILDEIKA